MIQRGRKGQNNISVFARPESDRPQPPNDFTEPECDLWEMYVSAKPPDLWNSTPLHLLEILCFSVVECRRVEGQLREIDDHCLTTDLGLRRFDQLTKMHAKLSASIAQLSTKLRFTPSTQIRADHAHVLTNNRPRRVPWEMSPDEPA